MTPPYIDKKSELIIHTAINSHPNPKDIALLIDLERKEFDRYKESFRIDEEIKDRYDVVFSDRDSALYATSALKDDGIAVFALELEDELCDEAAFLETITPSFRVLMPFFMPYSSKKELFIFASKKFHPTADLQLQRADMIDGLLFYTPYLHKAVFEQPPFIKKCFKGLLKN